MATLLRTISICATIIVSLGMEIPYIFGAEIPSAPISTWKIGIPIVTYWAGPKLTDKVAQQMADGGWNLVWCYDKTDLDVAKRHGLRGQLHHELLSPKTLEDPAKRQQLDALINRVSKHPAFYSYFLTDEPNTSQFADLGRLVVYLRQRDPSHLAYINLNPTYATPEQLGAKTYCEYLRRFVAEVKPALLSYDHYQFYVAGDVNNWAYFVNLGLMREAAQKAGIPFLNIVQAASWEPSVRVPNGDELRYLAYTTLAYGAHGISYYVYSAAGHKGGMVNADGSPTPLYVALKSINPEFSAVATELQSLQSLAVYHAGMMPPGAALLPGDAAFQLDPFIAPALCEKSKPLKGVALGFFGPAAEGDKKSQPTHVVAVNLDYKSEFSTTLVGPQGSHLEVFDAATRTWTLAQGSRAALHLPHGGGKLVRIGK